ncbi:hypothetical protein SAMD00023353_9000340 [Rosellinia necatrix]|uniref:Uncharacterized protein n=1 Tax=Rosellinia necatrix TaxID=77044 RepID=A0A1W2TW31_ROSNE|nr:hypothetical protein SAMD00023353_9000340 [Rosellinia necatrix]
MSRSPSQHTRLAHRPHTFGIGFETNARNGYRRTGKTSELNLTRHGGGPKLPRWRKSSQSWPSRSQMAAPNSPGFLPSFARF